MKRIEDKARAHSQGNREDQGGDSPVRRGKFKRGRAFDLLAAQPGELKPLSRIQRDMIVLSAVIDDTGEEFVVSRLGESNWKFQSQIKTPNTKVSMTQMQWPSDLPKALVESAKDALYLWMRKGRDNKSPPIAKSVLATARRSIPLIRHLAAQGARDFAGVKPLQITDYIATLRSRLKARSVRHCLEIIDLIWIFRDELEYALQDDPWSGLSFRQACGESDDDGLDAGKTGRTPVIPPSVQAKLFECAEGLLATAPGLLQRRDDGDTTAEEGLLLVRNAVLYILQITSGMRNVEAVGVQSHAWRTEVKHDAVYHWVRTTEHKTKRGAVDYLVPPETIAALELAVRCAEPFQRRLRSEIAELEAMLAASGAAASSDPTLSNGMSRVDALHRLDRARESVQSIFLTSKGPMSTMSGDACLGALRRLAKIAGVSWRISNHQCRRTFAWTVANSRLGRSGLVFLRWQLKHASVSWTQLYASNPRQDSALYEEMWSEFVEAQAEVFETWFDQDTALAGGAGAKIMETRAIPVDNRRALLLHTAESVTIRSTGHSWCLAAQQGCVGEGIYEATLCTDCSAGVIDQSHVDTWQRIHLDNLELGKVKDCGPSVLQRAKRDIARSRRTLERLCVPIPGQEGAPAALGEAVL